MPPYYPPPPPPMTGPAPPMGMPGDMDADGVHDTVDPAPVAPGIVIHHFYYNAQGFLFLI